MTVPSGCPVQWTFREFAIMEASMPAAHPGLSTRSKRWHLSILTLKERGATPDLDCFE
jgi:hypothetical protein